ncbi:MAG: YcjX family protein [Tabrizicola sp.]|nr:YcjX family protein [Tabrizicola sp.]
MKYSRFVHRGHFWCGTDRPDRAVLPLPILPAPAYLGPGRQEGAARVFSGLTDGISRGIEGAGASLSETFFDTTLRLGVTGLSRAGKTVFITALVANLLNRGRMPQLKAAAQGRIQAVYLQPQPDLTLPRFDYEAHLAALTGDSPRWPTSTRAISELRLSFRVQPAGFFSSWRGPHTLHLDIVDYPGEWLLDLALLDQSYEEWSEGTLSRLERRPEASAYLALARAEDGALRLDEDKARRLAADFTAYLTAARDKGRVDVTPGRFLLPGDLAGSPVLTFAPLPKPALTPRSSLWREMERRYEAYKSRVVRPFFRDHFLKIDRQVVLVDLLEAIHQGPRAVEDLRRTMAEVLEAFRPGRNSWLSSLFGTHRVERILFAATKADHLHHEQHQALTAITAALLSDAKSRADFSGARTEALSLASLRATVEEIVTRDGVEVPAVRGTLLSTGKPALMYPGALPSDPARLLSPAREGAEAWLDADYSLMTFAPARLSLKPGEGPPHIRLDRAVEFLIGDQL